VELGQLVLITGSIEGIGLLIISGPNATINGNFENTMGELCAESGASVVFNGSVSLVSLLIDDGASVEVSGNFEFAVNMTMQLNANLAVAGNLDCGATASSEIDLTATIQVGGSDLCAATP